MAEAIATWDATGNLSIDWRMGKHWHNATYYVPHDRREAAITDLAYLALREIERWSSHVENEVELMAVMAAVMRVAVAEMDKVPA